MPVWVRGNIESGVFVIFNHGGPGSSGTLESIIEVNPANGRVGEFIYNEIGTDETDKVLLVLEQPRHGAKNGDREILQRAIIEFIEEYR